MDQKQVLQNRTLNSIEQIKHGLHSEHCMKVFNDLLILQQIVPHLPKHTLRLVLTEFKKISKSLDMGASFEISFSAILRLLASSAQETPLLRDFLQCSFPAGVEIQSN